MFQALQLCAPEVHASHNLLNMRGHYFIRLGRYSYSVSATVKQKMCVISFSDEMVSMYMRKVEDGTCFQYMQLDTSKSNAWTGLIFSCEKLLGEPSH